MSVSMIFSVEESCVVCVYMARHHINRTSIISIIMMIISTVHKFPQSNVFYIDCLLIINQLEYCGLGCSNYFRNIFREGKKTVTFPGLVSPTFTVILIKRQKWITFQKTQKRGMFLELGSCSITNKLYWLNKRSPYTAHNLQKSWKKTTL